MRTIAGGGNTRYFMGLERPSNAHESLRSERWLTFGFRHRCLAKATSRVFADETAVRHDHQCASRVNPRTALTLALAIAIAALIRPARVSAQWTYNTDQGERSTKETSDKNSSTIVSNPPPVVDSSAPAQPIPNIPLILAPPFTPGGPRGTGMSPVPPQGVAPLPR